MSTFKIFLRAGHAPTLVSAFLYGLSCCIWVLNSAVAPFIADTKLCWQPVYGGSKLMCALLIPARFSSRSADPKQCEPERCDAPQLALALLNRMSSWRA